MGRILIIEWWKVGECGRVRGESGAETMFMGEYQHTIDDKGRMIVPAKFRDDLGSTFVLTRGLDQCVFGYPMEEWKLLEQKLKNLPFTKKDARAFTRFFFSGAIECQLDKQGRVNVSQPLREHAKLDKDCVVIGVSNRIEIWSKASWVGYYEESESSFEQISESLLDFDL